MEKRDLLNAVRGQLNAQMESVRKSTKEARQASIEAPSKMESRYDSTKSEMDWLAHAHALRGVAIRKQLEDLEKIDLSSSQFVRIGSLVTVSEKDEEDAVCFILPIASGIVLDTDEGDVIVVSPNTPVGSALMGKSEGASCDIDVLGNIRNITILTVG